MRWVNEKLRAQDGCEFEHFFSTTPGDLVQVRAGVRIGVRVRVRILLATELVQAGIFSQIATPLFYSGEFRKVPQPKPPPPLALPHASSACPALLFTDCRAQLSVSLISESFASNSSFGSKASSKTKQGGIDLKNLGIGSGRSGDGSGRSGDVGS